VDPKFNLITLKKNIMGFKFSSTIIGLLLVLCFSRCGSDDPAIGGISGVVLVNGLPESGVSISAENEDAETIGTSSTSSSGLFTFSDFPIGTYTLTISKTDFITQTKSVTVSSDLISEVEINLVAESGDMLGSVVDESGFSLEGASVELSFGGTIINTMTTDVFGEFGFTSIEIGSYSLTVSLAGFETQTISADVTPGATTNVTITLERAFGNLTVVVIDQFGGEMTDAQVELSLDGNVVDSKSGFSTNQIEFVDLLVGEYSATVTKEGFIALSETIEVLKDQTATLEARLFPESLPSGGIKDVRIKSFDNVSAIFEVDLFIVDDGSNSIANLTAADFSIESFTSSGFTFTFTISTSAFNNTNSATPYSAALLIDQSGSIRNTDPNGSRIQASKIYLNALGAGDEVILSAFSSGFDSQIPQSPLTIFGTTFTSVGNSFFDEADALAFQEGGGTPLFNSILSMMNFTAANGNNTNKAVVAFTDGEDTSGGTTIDDITSAASSTGVKVFTVGLGTGTDVSTLGKIASKTGGSFMNAADAKELVALFGTLGNLLNGSIDTYTLTISVVATGNAFPADLTTSIVVNSPIGPIVVPIFINIATSNIGRIRQSGSLPSYSNLKHIDVSDY